MSRAVQLLVGVGIVFLLLSHPSLAPENIFTKTDSRLQISTDVLFNRLSALRSEQAHDSDVASATGSGSGTFFIPLDEQLRPRLVSMESRYLYAAYGPDVVANCLFCAADDVRSYLFYILPELLFPHLLNLVVIGVATSSLLCSTAEMSAPSRGLRDNTAVRVRKAARQWRPTATYVAVVLAVVDVYLLYTTDPLANKSAKRLAEVQWFFWRYRTLRFFSIAFLDFAGAFLVWLSGTNRAFIVGGSSAAERVHESIRGLHAVKAKISAAGIVKNTTTRDAELRKRSDTYWAHEVALMGEVMQDREVLEGINDALASRLHLVNIQRDAEAYTDNVFRPMFVRQAMVAEINQPASPSDSIQSLHRTGSPTTNGIGRMSPSPGLAIGGDKKTI